MESVRDGIPKQKDCLQCKNTVSYSTLRELRITYGKYRCHLAIREDVFYWTCSSGLTQLIIRSTHY